MCFFTIKVGQLFCLQKMKQRCTQGGGRGRGHIVQTLLHTNEIKHEKGKKRQKKGKKGEPLYFLTTPSNPLKRSWPKPQGPPPPLYFQLLCIYGKRSKAFKSSYKKLERVKVTSDHWQRPTQAGILEFEYNNIL